MRRAVNGLGSRVFVAFETLDTFNPQATFGPLSVPAPSLLGVKGTYYLTVWYPPDQGCDALPPSPSSASVPPILQMTVPLSTAMHQQKEVSMKWATRNGRSPPFSADSRNLETPLKSYTHFTFRGAPRRSNYSVYRKSLIQ